MEPLSTGFACDASLLPGDGVVTGTAGVFGQVRRGRRDILAGIFILRVHHANAYLIESYFTHVEQQDRVEICNRIEGQWKSLTVFSPEIAEMLTKFTFCLHTE